MTSVNMMTVVTWHNHGVVGATVNAFMQSSYIPSTCLCSWPTISTSDNGSKHSRRPWPDV